MTTILLIEDDTVLAETLAYNLEREGYRILRSADGQLGLELAREHKPDLVILDVMLPSLDGFSICRILRRESNIPIMMLTAREDEVDRIAGLEMGADDYVVKPFSLGELLARVRALLRRTERPAGPPQRETLTIGALLVDIAGRRVFRDSVEIALSPKEFDLLVYLMRNPGVVMSRDLLLERVWGYEYSGDSRTVDVHIRWLREKIEPDSAQPSLIQTVRGIGYRFQHPGNEPHGR